MKFIKAQVFKKINLHQLGDIGCPLYGVLAKGKLFRSGNIEGLTKYELKFLESHNIHTRFDLRTDSEMDSRPCQLSSAETINFKISAGGGNGTYIDTVKSIDNNGQIEEVVFRSYHRLLGNSYENVGNLLAYLAEKRVKSSLIHCSAGKDRTGIVIAMLLKILDINILDIILDYQRAVKVYALNNYNNNMVLFDKHGMDYLKYRRLVEPTGDILKRLISYIEGRYETVVNYLYKADVKYGLFVKAQLKKMYLL